METDPLGKQDMVLRPAGGEERATGRNQVLLMRMGRPFPPNKRHPRESFPRLRAAA